MNDERPRTRPSPMLVAVIGISTAALGLALVNRIAPAPAEAQPGPLAPAMEEVAADPVRPAGAAGNLDLERMRRLERRLAELESSQGTEVLAQRAAPEAPEPLDPEAQLREESVWWAAILETHDRQGRDAAWAEKSEQLFRADLTAIAGDRKFETTEIDCRTSSCVVTLRWPSYVDGEIHKDASFLAGHSYRENCATSISVPPPEDPSVPYQAQLIFDCASLRAGVARR